MATVRPGIFPVPNRDLQRIGAIESVRANVGQVRTKVIERSVTAGMDIAKAEVVVIAGRGATSYFDSVRAFAGSIGGAVGVTRPLADKELLPRDYQVGSTGVAIAPKLAIVLGASGAAHFISGIRGAKTIISVNRDPEADINANADYVVIEDIGRLLPALISKFNGG
jgi:electron transfer flavoprotein alpha subunit